MPREFADALLAWWRAHDGTPVALTATLERLTGRAPRTFAAWAGEHASVFVPRDAAGPRPAAGAPVSQDRPTPAR
jgi:hypothetical protein